jgi:MOSC domain-containing protein YiiM
VEIEIRSVNVGRAKVLLEWSGGEVVSGIDKRPVSAASLRLSTVNLDGDEQADQRPTVPGDQVHGGPEKAVYAFPSEHLARVGEIVGHDVGPGFMGENVTIAGALEHDVCIGDEWAWGDARLQVTSPRGPCYKLGIKIGRQSARTIIREERLTGWYLRVLQEGAVPTSGTIDVVARHPAGVTVTDVLGALYDRPRVHHDLAALEVLSPGVRAAVVDPNRDIYGGVPEVD